MSLLNSCKLALRLSNDAYDNEVNDLIEACKLDLKLSGVASSRIVEGDPIIKQAIKTYCKAHFGYNADSEKFKVSYTLLKGHLAIAYSESEVAPNE